MITTYLTNLAWLVVPNGTDIFGIPIPIQCQVGGVLNYQENDNPKVDGYL